MLVLIPAYNSEKHIRSLLERIASTVPDAFILVVDDGSTDSTWEIASSFGATVIRHSCNRGKGRSLRDGFRFMLEGDFPLCITMDADLQHPPELIPNFIEKSRQGSDIVIGNRTHDLSQMPYIRRFSNWGTSLILSWMTGLRLPDSQCGFRLIKRWVLEKVNLTTSHYDTESELIIQAAKQGARIGFVPIPTIYNGNPSHIKKIDETARFFRLVARYLIRR
ncbi:glycosyltransferase family 2 protein [bacterium]|nr:glycosyltransferase family 2 protein [bacterium]